MVDTQNDVGISKETPIYVVLRDGQRVSDKEYDDPETPDAIQEWSFWKRVSETHSRSEPVVIAKYDPKIHSIS